MSRYNSYKETNISWIGEIPKHWTIKKFAYAVDSIGSGATPKSDHSEYYENGKINWLITGDLNDGEIFKTSNKITLEALKDYSTLKEYPPKSLMIAMYGGAATIGKLGILRIPSTTNQAICVASFNDDNVVEFWFYLFLEYRQLIISMSNGGVQSNINQEIINSLKFPTPPSKEEQERIAGYLDKKTAQIDLLIEKLERRIALLQEQRAALINHCVTKGLDPSVEMKDSGIAWMGRIPKSWTLSKIWRFADLVTDGSHYSPETEGAGKFYVTVSNVTKNFSIDFSTCAKISERSFVTLERNGCRPLPGDILITKDGTIGRGCVVKKNDFVILSSLGLIRVPRKNEPKFFLYFFLSPGLVEEMYSSIRGSGITRLNVKLIKDLPIIIPSPEEQKRIARHLDKKTAQIDSLAEKLRVKIERLKEYRQSLISSAVTGKIKITEEML